MVLRLQTLIGLAAGLGVGAVLGALAAERWRAGDPALTRIEMTACGIAPGPPDLALPLGALLADAAPAQISLGPFALGGVTGPVTLRFQAVEAPEAKRPRLAEAYVEAPVLLAGGDRLEWIALRCRYGRPAQISYGYASGRIDREVIAAPDDDRPARSG